MAADDDLLAYILAHPDDLTPRLVYADWLEEHGETERAEFIRVQIEMSQAEEYSPRWRQLEARQEWFLKNRKKQWLAPLKGLTLYARFFRGFVEDVTIYARTWLERGDRLLRLTPLRMIRCTLSYADYHVPLADVLASPLTVRLSGLALGNNIAVGDDQAHALAMAPNVAGLTTLDLERSRIGLSGVRLLANSRHLARLTSLNLTGVGHSPFAGEAPPAQGDAMLAEIMEGPALVNLTSLNLGLRGVSDRGLVRLAQRTGLPGLSALSLDQTDSCGEAGLEALAQAPSRAGLKLLGLRNCRAINDAAVRALAASPSLRLTQLILGRDNIGHGVPITNAGAQALASSLAMAELRLLDLEGHQVGDAGAEAIAVSPHLGQLGCLNLKGNPINKDVQKALRKRFGPGVCTFSRPRQ
jgi:uncharacterized protein (TIGR02996 family)